MRSRYMSENYRQVIENTKPSHLWNITGKKMKEYWKIMLYSSFCNIPRFCAEIHEKYLRVAWKLSHTISEDYTHKLSGDRKRNTCKIFKIMSSYIVQQLVWHIWNTFHIIYKYIVTRYWALHPVQCAFGMQNQGPSFSVHPSVTRIQ